MRIILSSCCSFLPVRSLCRCPLTDRQPWELNYSSVRPSALGANINKGLKLINLCRILKPGTNNYAREFRADRGRITATVLLGDSWLFPDETDWFGYFWLQKVVGSPGHVYGLPRNMAKQYLRTQRDRYAQIMTQEISECSLIHVLKFSRIEIQKNHQIL